MTQFSDNISAFIVHMLMECQMLINPFNVEYIEPEPSQLSDVDWEKSFCFPPHFCDVKVAQLCPTLCNSMDYTVHGILLDRMFVWVALPFSRGSSQAKDQAQVSCIEANSLPSEPSGKPFCRL